MANAEIMSANTWAPGIFAGKVLFCTGGAGTICSGQVKALVKLGANAAIISRRAEVAADKASEIAAVRPGSFVLGIQGDVRSMDSLKAAAAETVKKLGKIDFLICGAAGNFLSSFDNLSANAFRTVVEIDLLGSFNATKACADELKKNKGRIIYVSATLHYTGTPLQTHAAAAKAGVDALSAQMCIEYGPWGVTSNVIAPGATAATEGFDRLSDAKGRVSGHEGIPLQRYGTVSEIADATVFLFSPAAKYITGTVIPVDGGYSHVQGPVHTQKYPDCIMGSSPSRL